jgi:hypoxanthine phosphoribosyltransferase
MKKRYITWSSIDDAVRIIALKILNSGVKITNIKGIPRGGLIPAVLLSHQLNIPLIKGEPVSENTLVVDDICDTGHTLKFYDFCPTVTLHYKTSATFKPTFYVDAVKEDVWYVYPWEKLNSNTMQDYLKLEKDDIKLSTNN